MAIFTDREAGPQRIPANLPDTNRHPRAACPPRVLAGRTRPIQILPMKPRSAEDETKGLRYFPRLLDKIRLNAAGKLDPEYHENLGHGADRRLIKFLRVEYDKLCDRVQQGGDDEEILEWCYNNGHRLYKNDIEIWNGFIFKLGWNDFASNHLEKCKAAAGLEKRSDIQTLAHLFDVEEGRKK
jgi:gluconokinase